MKNTSKFAPLTVLGASLYIVAFAQVSDDQPKLPAKRHQASLQFFPAPSGPPQFGDPLRGLTTDQLAPFGAGLENFQEVDTPASGLGPIFNNVSCVACHSVAAIGGSSAILETRFGRLMNGHFDPLTELGGSLLQQSAIDPACQEFVPPEANVIAQRQTTPL